MGFEPTIFWSWSGRDNYYATPPGHTYALLFEYLRIHTNICFKIVDISLPELKSHNSDKLKLHECKRSRYFQ
jgi:hypothetical protein